jgi:hypothetical protein
MTDIDARLDQLGEALHAAAEDDFAAGRGQVTERRPGRRRRVQLGLALCALVLAVPALAFATGTFDSDQEVADGLPAGYAMLEGTDPVCATLREEVEYDCVLASPPKEVGPPPGFERAIGEFVGAPGEWKGVVIATVDETHRTNGGCRSMNEDGTDWRCFLGLAAIRHKIIGPKILNDYLPNPVER